MGGSQKSAFISYSHRDRDWLDRLRRWLEPLERKGLITFWDDDQIPPAAKWRDVIENQLAKASAGLFLVTQEFLFSEFITREELAPLLARAERGGEVKVLWLAVKPSTVEDTPIAEYQALNDPAKPLSTLTEAEQDAALLSVYQRLRRLLEADEDDD